MCDEIYNTTNNNIQVRVQQYTGTPILNNVTNKYNI